MIAGYLRAIDYAGPSSVRTRQAYARLIAAILTDGRTTARAFGGGGWVAVDDPEPYAGLDALQIAAFGARHYQQTFHVSDENHNGAFLGNHAANLAFRAHHDATHALEGLGFSFASECLVTRAQIERLHLADGWSLTGADARAVLIGEVIGQGLYFDRFGAFPLTKYGTQPTFNVTDATAEWAADALTEYTEGL